ncbi:MAG: hypothetical protein LBB06_01675 [Endomicrobium sp.]|nr:hypothetical protein [Endomicrobium sp.]
MESNYNPNKVVSKVKDYLESFTKRKLIKLCLQQTTCLKSLDESVISKNTLPLGIGYVGD